MKPDIARRSFAAFAAVLIAFPAALPAEDDNSRHNPAAGRIAYHYVGRVSLNFLNGTGIVYGYLTDLAGVTPAAALFHGTPGETTALLTFRANISFQLLPGNGPIGNGQFAVTPTLVTPGDFQIYFTPSPVHDWTDPNTFSSGQVIATLARGLEQFSVLATFSSNAGSAALQSSAPFSLNGHNMNLRDIFPNGITDITTGPAIPLPGSTATAPIFAFAGYAVTIGD
jgi:hypothetical protein